MPEFPGGAWWPERRTWGQGSTVGGLPVAAHTPYWTLGGAEPAPLHQALVVQAPATGAIIGFRIVVWLLQDTTGTGGPGPVSGPGVMRFSCQTLDPATGWPSGTGAFSPEFTTYTVYAGGVGSQYETLFTESFAVERGDLFACVWELTHHVPDYTLCTVRWPYAPRPNTSPHYGFESIDLTTWTTSGGTPLGSLSVPPVCLLYDDAALHRAPGDILPMRADGRLAPTGYLTLTPAMDPIGVSFTVPRSLTCDGCAFSFYLGLGDQVRVTLTGPDVSVSVDREGVNPIYVGYHHDNWAFTFDAAVTLRPGVTYTATLQPLVGSLGIKGAMVDPDMLTDFEGGPTWVSFGDPDDLVDRWFFFLHLPGPADELPGAPGFTVRDCVVLPVCPEEEEPGPTDVTPSVVVRVRPGTGPLQLRGRHRGRG